MTRRNLRDILEAFAAKRILIVGDVMLDEYVWGDVRRVSPEAPVPVVEIQRRSYVAGGAANTAANVVSLGGRARLGGVVGRDQAAERLHEVLAPIVVDAGGLVVDSERPTTTKSRVIAHSQQVVRIDSECRQPISGGLERVLLSWVEQSLHNVDACILSDYDKGVVSFPLAEGFIQLARKTGKPIVVDPKGTDYVKYRGATVITPNVHEASRALNQEINGHSDLVEVSRQLLDILEGAALLLTRGAEGMSLFRNGTNVVHIPATARNVFDVTGAGDTVVGTLALALAAGATLEQAAGLANRAAGIVVGKFGTSTVMIDELLETVK